MSFRKARNLFLGVLCVLLLSFPSFAQAAVGGVVKDCQSIAAGAYLDIQPAGGTAWAVRNISFAYDVQIDRYDGTLTVAAKQLFGADYQNFFPVTQVTNGNRIRIKNLHGSTAQLICYNGLEVPVAAVKVGCTSVSASSTLDILPAAGEEWLLYNVWFEDNIELQDYDGTNTLPFAQVLGPDWESFPQGYHLNETDRVRAKNLNGGAAKVVCYDATKTK